MSGPSRGLVEKAAGVISAFYPARGGSWSRVLGREVLSAVWPALVEEAREGVREEEERTVYWNKRWFDACTDLAAARDLVRRAAPFVNAVACMADDKSAALAWLADAAGSGWVRG